MGTNLDEYTKNYDRWVNAGRTTTAIGFLMGVGSNWLAKRKKQKAEARITEINEKLNECLCRYDECVGKAKYALIELVSVKKEIMKKEMRRFVKSYRRINPNILLKKPDGLNDVQYFTESFSVNDFNLIESQISIYNAFNPQNKKAGSDAYIMLEEGIIDHLAEGISNYRTISEIENPEKRQAELDKLKIDNISTIAEISVASLMFGLSGLAEFFNSSSIFDRVEVYEQEVNLKIAEINNKIVDLNAIRAYADAHINALKRLKKILPIYVDEAYKIIYSKDNFFHLGSISEEKFNDEELEKLAFTMALVQAVKAIINSPVLSNSGKVFSGDKSQYISAVTSISQYERNLHRNSSSSYASENRDPAGLPIRKHIEIEMSGSERLLVDRCVEKFANFIGEKDEYGHVEQRIRSFFAEENNVFVNSIRELYEEELQGNAKKISGFCKHFCIIDNSEIVRINGRLSDRKLEGFKVYNGSKQSFVSQADKLVIHLFETLWKPDNTLADKDELIKIFDVECQELIYEFNVFLENGDCYISKCVGDIDNISQNLYQRYKFYLDNTKRDYTGIEGVRKNYFYSEKGFIKDLFNEMPEESDFKELENFMSERRDILIQQKQEDDFKRVLQKALVDYLVYHMGRTCHFSKKSM